MTETTVETTQVTEEVKNPEAVLAELRRAQEDLKNLRAEYNKLTQERDDFKKQVEDDVWKTKALLAETKNALAKQGIKDADRLMPYIGTDGLELSEDGKVNGLDERLKQLRADLPEVFDPKRIRHASVGEEGQRLPRPRPALRALRRQRPLPREPRSLGGGEVQEPAGGLRADDDQHHHGHWHQAASGLDLHPATADSRSTGAEAASQTLTATQKRRLARIYAADFELLGYER